MKDEDAPKKNELCMLRSGLRAGGPGTNVRIENEGTLLTLPR